jgi:hypothetical protein
MGILLTLTVVDVRGPIVNSHPEYARNIWRWMFSNKQLGTKYLPQSVVNLDMFNSFLIIKKRCPF